MTKPREPWDPDSIVVVPPLTKETCRFNPYPPRAYDKHLLSEAEVADLEQRLAGKP